MSSLSPSRLSASAKIAMFEDKQFKSPSQRRRQLSDTKLVSSSSQQQQRELRPKPIKTPSRQPLGFLSPNIRTRGSEQSKSKHPSSFAARMAHRLETSSPFAVGRTSSPTKRPPSDGAEMKNAPQLETKQEMKGLQSLATNHQTILQQYKGDATDSHRALLTLIQEQAAENLQKEQDLQRLRAKAVKIEQGLADSKDERQVLTDKNKQLEADMQHLQLELVHREKEISSLSRRCATQAEKMKESTQLRVANQELSQQAQELKSSHARRDQQDSSLARMKHELEQSRQERDDLEERLNTVKKDRDAVSENMCTCLTNLDKLTQEKREWEEERQRLLQRAMLDQEQHRLEHAQETIGLKEDLRSRDEKIDILEQSVHEKTSSLRSMKHQMAELERSQAKTMGKVNEDLQRAVNVVSKRYETQIKHEKIAHSKELKSLRSELDDKNNMVAMMEADLAATMEKLMIATRSLQKAEEDSAMFHALTVDIESLEYQRHNLAEALHEKETHVAELSAEILKLESEKELTAQDAQRLEQLSAELASLQHEKEALQAHLKQQTAQSDEKIRYLEAELQQVQDKHRAVVDRLESRHVETVATLELKVKRLETHVQENSTTAKSDLSAKAAEIASLENRLRRAGNRIRSLEEDIRKSEESKQVLARQLKTFHDEEVAELQSRIKNVLRSKDEESAAYRKELGAKDETISSLKDGLQLAHNDLKQGQQTHRGELAAMRQELKKCETALALKDDEIRDLRMIELPEKEEKSTLLESEIAWLTNELESKEAEHSHTIDDRDAEIEQLALKVDEFDRRNEEKCREHQSVVEDFTQAIIDLKRENDQKQLTIQGYERRIQETDIDVASLSQKLSQLERNNGELREECRKLYKSSQRAISEKEKLEIALERESSHRESLIEEERAAQEKLISQQEQMAALEEVLQDRTKILHEMVDHNKTLETEIEKKESLFDDLAQEASDLQSELMDKERELASLRAEWKNREDGYLDELNTERNRREIAESDLMLTRSSMNVSKEESKTVAELEKENQALKDKVRRQEAYLKRKIEKDKVLRDRVNPSKTTAPTGIQASRKRSVADTQATRSTPASDTSLDRELDALLAD